jgi:hypothetical protein
MPLRLIVSWSETGCFKAVRFVPSSDSSHQQQDDEDEENDAENAARAISPAAAVRPSGHCAEEKQDYNDEKDGTRCHGTLRYKVKSAGKLGSKD